LTLGFVEGQVGGFVEGFLVVAIVGIDSDSDAAGGIQRDVL
jgi:hypothetical protein